MSIYMSNYFIDISKRSFILNKQEYPVSETSRIDSDRLDQHSKFYYYYENDSKLGYDVVEVSVQLAYELIELLNVYHKS